MHETKIIQKDPLWDEEFEMGAEGLIATIEDSEKLIEALKKNIQHAKERLANY